MNEKRRPFSETLLQLATNKPFCIIFLFLGAAMGYISTLQTKLEQVRGGEGNIDPVILLCIIKSWFLLDFKNV